MAMWNDLCRWTVQAALVQNRTLKSCGCKIKLSRAQMTRGFDKFLLGTCKFELPSCKRNHSSCKGKLSSCKLERGIRLFQPGTCNREDSSFQIIDLTTGT